MSSAKVLQHPPEKPLALKGPFKGLNNKVYFWHMCTGVPSDMKFPGCPIGLELLCPIGLELHPLKGPWEQLRG